MRSALSTLLNLSRTNCLQEEGKIRFRLRLFSVRFKETTHAGGTRCHISEITRISEVKEPRSVKARREFEHAPLSAREKVSKPWNPIGHASVKCRCVHGPRMPGIFRTPCASRAIAAATIPNRNRCSTGRLCGRSTLSSNKPASDQTRRLQRVEYPAWTLRFMIWQHRRDFLHMYFYISAAPNARLRRMSPRQSVCF